MFLPNVRIRTDAEKIADNIKSVRLTSKMRQEKRGLTTDEVRLGLLKLELSRTTSTSAQAATQVATKRTDSEVYSAFTLLWDAFAFTEVIAAIKSTLMKNDSEIDSARNVLGDILSIPELAQTINPRSGKIDEGRVQTDEKQRTSDVHLSRDIAVLVRAAGYDAVARELAKHAPPETQRGGLPKRKSRNLAEGPTLPSFEKPAALKTRRRRPSAELDAQVKDLGRVRAAQQLLTTYHRRKGVELTEAEQEQLREARRLVRAYERRRPSHEPG